MANDCEAELLTTINVLLLTSVLVLKRQQGRQKRTVWVHELWRHRDEVGQANCLLPRIRCTDEAFFRESFSFLRMTPAGFDTLLGLVRGRIQRRDTKWRKAIPASERLALTLRFLANGDTLRSASFNFLVGRTTAGRIVRETCEAIWDCLQGEYLAFPSTTEEWRQIASDMENRWQFPNCIGSIDGKHISIECPANSGSQYYSYKGTFSVVLLAVCDAQYRFTYVDIGHLGGESDAGIFARSRLLQVLENNEFGIPGPSRVGSAGLLPHCIVGDEAFPLTTFLMRPYSRRAATEYRQKVFNYRLSRARRLIENAFGILASRWRILRRPFRAKPENVERIVKACVVLHNFVLRTSPSSSTVYNPPGFTDYEDQFGNVHRGSWRSESDALGAFQELGGIGYHSKKSAMAVRDKLAAYFTAEGELPWQDKHI